MSLEEINRFYLQLEEPQQSCFLALRGAILGVNSTITQEWKYKLPFFYYRKKMLCYLWMDKKTRFPYVCFCDGNYMEHPLLQMGERKRMKAMHLNPEEDLPLPEIEYLVSWGVEILDQKLKNKR